jgi:hypothetical protein
MSEADDIQIVTFRVGFQEFGFDILQIQRTCDTSRLPACRRPRSSWRAWCSTAVARSRWWICGNASRWRPRSGRRPGS